MLFSQEYVASYKQHIELQATEYVKAGAWTLSQGYQYVDNLINTVFGNEKHSGIIDFLVSQQHLKLNEQDLIAHAVNYVNQGWHVAPMGSKYFLLSGEFKRVADVTGPSSIVPASAIIDIDIDNMHMMFEQDIASQIVQFAASKSITPQEVRVATFMLELFTKNQDDVGDLYGYVQNYYNLFKVLEKFTFYKGSMEEGVSIRELYALGYRISGIMNPTDEPRAYLQKGSDVIVLRPLQRDVSILGPINNDLVNLLGTRLQNELLEKYSVITDVPTEITELSATFSLAYKYDNFSFNNLDFYETERMLRVIDTQSQSGLYPAKNVKKITEAVAALAITRILLLGDSKFNPGSFSIDTVNNKVYSKYTGTLFTTDIQSLKMYQSNTKTHATSDSKTALLSIAEDRYSLMNRDWDVVTSLCRFLPEGFVKEVQSISIDELVGGISDDIKPISDYFQIAQQTLVRAVGK